MAKSTEGAVVAKIKAMHGKKIQKNQLIELSNCKSVSAIAYYLKTKTNYNKILKHVDENTIHRGQLENLLKQQNFNNYEKIFHYLNNRNKTIFKIAMEEFEVLEILRIILLLKANNMKDYITKLPSYLISKCEIDLINLAGIKNYKDLLNLLKNTHYFKILKRLTPPDETQKIDYNVHEQELFKHFFERLFQTIEKNVNKNEKIELKKLIKLRIDYLNAYRIYRLKIIFKKNSEEIKKRIFPFYRILNEQKINSLVDSKNSEKFELKFKNFFHISKNFKHNPSFSNKENYYIENFINKLNYKTCNKLIHLSNSFSTVFYAFHKLTQIELSNLIYVIEGVRYGIATKEIQNLYVF